MGDEVLSGIIPPAWRVGQTWTVEQFAWMSRGINAWPPTHEVRITIDFEVIEHDEAKSVVVVRPREPIWRGNDRHVITIARRPFRPIRRAWRYAGKSELGEDDEGRPGGLVEAFELYDEQVVCAFPSSPEALRMANAKEQWSVSGEVASYRTRTNQDAAERVVTWRKGDPWWARHEVLGKDGRTFPRVGTGMPGTQYRDDLDRDWFPRGRLIAIDGKPIAPLPWSD